MGFIALSPPLEKKYFFPSGTTTEIKAHLETRAARSLFPAALKGTGTPYRHGFWIHELLTPHCPHKVSAHVSGFTRHLPRFFLQDLCLVIRTFMSSLNEAYPSRVHVRGRSARGHSIRVQSASGWQQATEDHRNMWMKKRACPPVRTRSVLYMPIAVGTG